MDLSKFKTSDWLKVGGGAGFLIFGTFFSWAKISFGGFSESGGNAFDFFFRGTIPWLLIVGTGVVAFLLAAGILKPGKLPWPLVILGAAALGTLLNFLIVLMGPKKSGVEFDRGVGLYLSFISAVVCLVGAFLGFKESGGNVNDLKDINKIKGAFNTGGSGSGSPMGMAPPPPPPPPPAPPTAPPPPPPPPG